jgi:RNA polymerase-binding transcription factor DksA
MNPSTELATTDLTAHLPALRAALEEQRCFRLTQLEELEAGAVAGAADDARGEVAAAVKLAAQAALADITTALHRLDEGSYGRCERCGTAIPLERLEILPMSRLCMPCQHAKETGRPRAPVTANRPTPRPDGQRGGQHPTRRRAGR